MVSEIADTATPHMILAVQRLTHVVPFIPIEPKKEHTQHMDVSITLRRMESRQQFHQLMTLPAHHTILRHYINIYEQLLSGT